MGYDSSVKTKVSEYNRVNADDSRIYIWTPNKATSLIVGTNVSNKPIDGSEIYWVKYQIKETDLRVKTASFTTTEKLDLTVNVHIVKIRSRLHENFNGYVLSNEYTENEDGTYTYQCQDMSRQYIGKFDMIVNGITLHRLLKSLLSAGRLPINTKLTESLNKKYKPYFSGLRPLALYEGKLWGNPISLNMMAQKPKLIIRNKSYIEAIREICFANGYVDVYFDSVGNLQIEPISLDDWKHTGLWLTTDEIADREFKFDTTNAITGATIQSTDTTKASTPYGSKTLTGLNLASFFGIIYDTSSNPNQASSSGKSSSSGSTSKATTKNKNTNNTTTTANKYGNPFNNKPKRIIVSADKGGRSDFKSEIVKLLKKDGWSVTDLGIGSDQHSRSYEILSSKYSVNLVIYNGMCAGTIKECYDGWLKGKHERYGVALVNMWDTSSWTARKGQNNPKGDWYHRHGDMSDYYLATAHDWGNGGNPNIKDVAAYFKKYKVLYCCGPTPAQAYNQFKAGGYAKMKGLY